MKATKWTKKPLEPNWFRAEEEKSVADKVYDQLRRQIVTLQRRPRDPLREKLLVDEFGTSRTPVREACLRLQRDDLVCITPKSGTFVAPIWIPLVLDAHFLRMAAETAVIKELSVKISDEQVAELADIVERQIEARKANELAVFGRLDELFHSNLYEFAGHPHARRAVERQKVHWDRIRYVAIPDMQHTSEVIHDHNAIVEALQKRDPVLAERAVVEHLRTLPDYLEGLSRSRPELFETKM
ncbi:GntR family transcriptional regulator [Pseudovibrio flavus]|uniref:GntR family transcriptional regulator n=1 Tax=Pseudovibrio flavus TaxID=2529854 RepID=UPI00211CC9BB|nr:GntR family transcriptional regulator [Pseudovibrio flavus]